MKGRKPIPTQLKKARGNPGKRALNKNEPTPDKCLPSMPKYVNAETRAEWKREVPELYANGLITTVFVGNLLRTYERLDDYWTLRKDILIEGWTIEMRGSMRQMVVRPNPKVALMEKAWKDHVDGKRGFGGDPGSMSRVSRVEPKENSDPFEKFEGSAFKVHQGGKT